MKIWFPKCSPTSYFTWPFKLFFHSSVTDASFVDEMRVWCKYKILILVPMMSLFFNPIKDEGKCNYSTVNSVIRVTSFKRNLVSSDYPLLVLLKLNLCVFEPQFKVTFLIIFFSAGYESYSYIYRFDCIWYYILFVFINFKANTVLRHRLFKVQEVLTAVFVTHSSLVFLTFNVLVKTNSFATQRFCYSSA